MTTYNHTLVAVSVAIMTKNAPLSLKIPALGLLCVSHIPFDALPHLHWYTFSKLKESIKDRWGALIELFGGLIILPIMLGLSLHLDLFWLAGFVVAASLVDFLVAIGFRAILRINHLAHFWEGKVSRVGLLGFEISQTILLTLLVWFLHQAA